MCPHPGAAAKERHECAYSRGVPEYPPRSAIPPEEVGAGPLPPRRRAAARWPGPGPDSGHPSAARSEATWHIWCGRPTGSELLREKGGFGGVEGHLAQVAKGDADATVGYQKFVGEGGVGDGGIIGVDGHRDTELVKGKERMLGEFRDETGLQIAGRAHFEGDTLAAEQLDDLRRAGTRFVTAVPRVAFVE